MIYYHFIDELMSPFIFIVIIVVHSYIYLNQIHVFNYLKLLMLILKVKTRFLASLHIIASSHFNMEETLFKSQNKLNTYSKVTR